MGDPGDSLGDTCWVEGWAVNQLLCCQSLAGATRLQRGLRQVPQWHVHRVIGWPAVGSEAGVPTWTDQVLPHRCWQIPLIYTNCL